MAKRYYNLEKETKAFLKRMDETRGVLPDSAGIARINDYIVKRKGSGLFLGNVSSRTAVKFESAKSQYLTINSNTSLQTGVDGFTFSLWFKNILSTGDRIIICKNISGAVINNEYELMLRSGGLLFIVSDGLTNYTANTGSGVISNNIIYNIVCTFNNSTKTLNVYVNNTLRATTAFPNLPLQASSSFNIGRRGNNTGFNDSIVSDVGFWKRTLSDTELTYLYNNQLGRPYLELLAYNPNILTNMSSYWALNEQSGIRRDWHGTNNLQSFNTPESDVGLINNFFYLS